LDFVHGLHICPLGLGYAFLSFGACLVFVKTLMTKEIVRIYDYNQPGLRGMRDDGGLGIYNTLGITWCGWTVEERHSLWADRWNEIYYSEEFFV